MGLTDALYTGTSGLRALGHGMSVIGDNVSNLNTTGFKGARITFSDVMAQSINTAAGSGQLGRGANIQALYAQFTQGAFETTANPTDMAIAGAGFFILRNPQAVGGVFYSRDGQFIVDKEGFLVNPQGLRVQGWRIDEVTNDIVGTLTDIRIDRTSPPVKTTKIDVITNLDAREERIDIGAFDINNNTLYALWDATQGDEPISSTVYTYRTSLLIYDSLGTPHEITIYYRPVKVTIGNETKSVYEFLVTCNPNEDMRQFAREDLNQGKEGVLMYGMLEFDTQGNVIRFLNTYRLNPETGDLVRLVDETGLPDDDTSDEDVEFSDGSFGALGPTGYPLMIADFLGINIDTNIPKSQAREQLQLIELNFGYYYKTLTDNQVRQEAIRTTQYAAPSATIFYDQNGFGPGALENIAVDNEGRISGVYSNGRIVPLWMVGLANFNAPERLQKVGSNLFRETTHSGPPLTGKPGTTGLGTIAPNSLEQSNVDLGEQFVKMIIFQRGFQADARIITVSDSMLEELINLKR
ncbi:MAG: flagellar hook protein FlgE [Thermodesulfobacterium sp.]|nr:flagellar hook protein FlgE [Thermodesulfobacterium sp.]